MLTDIQGLEDFFGDMDFKVAGTEDGITAIQLDMKLQGISNEVVEKAIQQTKKARMYILDEVMNVCISEARKEMSPFAPKSSRPTSILRRLVMLSDLEVRQSTESSKRQVSRLI